MSQDGRSGDSETAEEKQVHLSHNQFLRLTLKDPFISERCIEIKIELNFYFYIFSGASKGFMKAFKAFIKPFEAPQRSVKIKI